MWNRARVLFTQLVALLVVMIIELSIILLNEEVLIVDTKSLQSSMARKSIYLQTFKNITDEVIDNQSPTSPSSMMRRSIYLETFKNITGEIIDNQSLTSPNLLLSHIDNANLNIPIPRNFHVLLMGDSLTRHQHLDLAYFLSHNRTWNNASATPNMVMEVEHGSWNGFYNFTNGAL